MGTISEIYNLMKDFIDNEKRRSKEEKEKYIMEIYNKTEIILRNYFEMFSDIRIGIISGKLDVNGVIEYLLKREYELKDVRIYVRSVLKSEYYNNNDTKLKFIAAIYGIMECYPVQNSILIDKSRHTIDSYINFCKSILMDNEVEQKRKILHMTEGILKDLTTSWQTVCECYTELAYE